MKTFNIKLFGVELEVDAEVEEPEYGDYDNPPFGGEIDIQEISHNGESIYDLVCEIPNWEQKINEEIYKQIQAER